MIATHPRSTSTALERAFLTRKDVSCVHEPFGEAFYFGPERLSDRYDEAACQGSENKDTSFLTVVNDILETAQSSESGSNEAPIVVIKDMAQYIIPPHEHQLADKKDIVAHSFQDFGLDSDSPAADSANPTMVPTEFLTDMNYVFLVRPPHLSIPSYYKCCIPPQSKETGFDHYRSSEAGYRELRILYDYVTKLSKDPKSGVKAPIVVDSVDLIENPTPIISRICAQGNIDFVPEMLSWGQNSEYEVRMFEKWKGFHNDALNSTGFRVSDHAKPAATASQTKKGNDDFEINYPEWEKKWNQRFDSNKHIVDDIKKSVEEHMDDYLYLRQFRITA